MVRRLLIIALVVFGASVIACGANENEVVCEEAVAHLAQCCPGFDGYSVSCEVTLGCDSRLHYPTLTIAKSRCIIGADCDTIKANHICDRVMQQQPSVCP